MQEEKANKKKRGNPAFVQGQENPYQHLANHAKKKVGQFRTKLLLMLENSEQTVKKKNVLKFLDKFDNEIKTPDTEKIYSVIFKQDTYDTILRTMVQQAARGDRHAREQVLVLAQGYREAEAESHDAMKEFFDKIIVGYEQPPLDITPYEELNRQID